jgi:hypothetical protein
MSSDKTHLQAHSPNRVAASFDADGVARSLQKGPVGGLVIASFAVAILFLGWLAFYFLLFMPRGAIG